MNQMQGIETLYAVRFVVVEEGSLTPIQFRTEVEAMLASGKVWVGSLTLYRDVFGHQIQGRQISKRAIVSNWPELIAQIVSLLGEDAEDAEPFGKSGSCLVNGLLIRAFIPLGRDRYDRMWPIVIDCVGNNLFRAYHPTQEDQDRGLCGSRSYTILGGEVCYAD